MPESNIPTSNCPPEFPGLIEINRQMDVAVDEDAVRQVVARILGDAGFQQGSISIAIVDDAVIQRLNARYLQHDYPTDVLSFTLETDDASGRLEGELIVSGETAERVAAEYGWDPQDELMLYLIHGALHLTGMDDSTDEQRAGMRAAEDSWLQSIGLTRPRLASGKEQAT
jgi:probable rRNA maturation factor